MCVRVFCLCYSDYTVSKEKLCFRWGYKINIIIKIHAVDKTKHYLTPSIFRLVTFR